MRIVLWLVPREGDVSASTVLRRLVGVALLVAVVDGCGAQERPGSTDAGGEVCPMTCADVHACTADSCVSGGCLNAPDDGACGADERCSVALGCVPFRCTSDLACSDGVYCNGLERCDATAGGSGCVAGADIVCNDDARCTVDACDEVNDRCDATPDDTACGDDVGCTTDRCAPGPGADAGGCTHTPVLALCAVGFCTEGGTCDPADGCVGGTSRDCSDDNPCTTDNCDEAAASCQNVLRDDDDDGFGPVSVVGPSGEVLCGGTDCDDDDDALFPGAAESCDGFDNDCSGAVDEGCGPLPDTCATAAPIGLDASSQTGVVTSRFAGFTDDYTTNPSCGAGAGGRDAVYYVDLPSGTWDLRVDTEGALANTVLSLSTDCSLAGVGNACNNDRAADTEASRIWLHRASGEVRVYILVDAFDAAETDAYTVHVALTPAAPDLCSSSGGASALDITGGGTVVGAQTDFFGAVEGSCQPGVDTSSEAAFRVSATSTILDVEASSPDFIPDLHIRRASCRSDDEVACELGSATGGGANTASLRHTVSPGDVFFVFVDGGRGNYVSHYEPF